MKRDTKTLLREFYEANETKVTEALKSGNLEDINELVLIAVKKELQDFDYTEYFYETKRVGFEDTVYLEIPVERADVYQMAPGATIVHSNYPTVTRTPIARFPLSVSVTENELDKLSALPKLEDMIEKLTTQLETEIKKYAISLLDNALTQSGYVGTIDTSVQGWDVELKNYINEVYENIRDGDEVYILGRAKALSKISALPTAEVFKAEATEKGFIHVFHGAQLKRVSKVGLKQEFLQPENVIYIVSPSCGKFVYFGEPIRDEYKPSTWVKEVAIAQFIGGAIITDLGRAYKVVLENL